MILSQSSGHISSIYCTTHIVINAILRITPDIRQCGFFYLTLDPNLIEISLLKVYVHFKMMFEESEYIQWYTAER